MSDHLSYDELRADTVRQVAKLMAASDLRRVCHRSSLRPSSDGVS